MTVFWRRVGITAAAVVAVAGATPVTAQADSFVHYTCEYVSPVFYNPLGPSWAIANGCEGPAGNHRHAFFDDEPPWAAHMCETTSAYQVSGREGLDVTGHNCV